MDSFVDLDMQLLGPLTITSAMRAMGLSALKPKKVLALLLLHANQVVPVSSLSRELWEDEPPASMLTTLQTYVLQLRKLFAELLHVPSRRIATELLITRGGGYLLRAQPGQLDRDRYDRLALTGRRALATGATAEASSILDAALRLWRGPALVDVTAGSLLASEIQRLEESRLVTLEHRIEADLRLGRHHEVVSELAGLTTTYPMHENLHAQHMLALYRCGRRPDALAVFHQVRGKLVDELGIEPSPPLHRLHRAILSSDPAVEGENNRGGLLLDYFAGAGQR